jgi:hypothetical protein
VHLLKGRRHLVGRTRGRPRPSGWLSVPRVSLPPLARAGTTADNIVSSPHGDPPRIAALTGKVGLNMIAGDAFHLISRQRRKGLMTDHQPSGRRPSRCCTVHMRAHSPQGAALSGRGPTTWHRATWPSFSPLPRRAAFFTEAAAPPYAVAYRHTNQPGVPAGDAAKQKPVANRAPKSAW